MFIPIFLEGRINDTDLLIKTFSVFIIFLLCSFIVYIFNDICDLDDDRTHSEKKSRPLAAGTIPISHAWLLLGGLAAGVIILLAWANLTNDIVILVACYLVANVVYSLGLKRIPVVDLLIVASGYILRLVAGNVAIDTAPNIWVLLVIVPGCLLLVAGKRKFDVALAGENRNSALSSRLYTNRNLSIGLGLAAIATIAAMARLAYLPEMTDRFGEKTMLVFAALVTGVVVRYLFLAVTNEKIGDPARLVFRDWPIFLACLSMIVLAATKIYP